MNESILPDKCPSCGETLIWSDTNIDLLCQNINCPAQILYKIEYFLRILGVEELSSTTLEKFQLSCIEDVYSKLTYDFILSLDGFQKRKTEVILEQLKKLLIDVNPAKLIAAFGIPGLGLKNAEKLIFHSNLSGNKSIEYFFNVNLDELLFINGFGKKLIDNINLNRSRCFELYTFLLSKGLTFKNKIEGKLQNKIITLTGSSSNGMNRTSIEKLIEKHGGQNAGISKKTSILVADNINGNSSKLKYARQNNIQIITYNDLFKLLED